MGSHCRAIPDKPCDPRLSRLSEIPVKCKLRTIIANHMPAKNIQLLTRPEGRNTMVMNALPTRELICDRSNL